MRVALGMQKPSLALRTVKRQDECYTLSLGGYSLGEEEKVRRNSLLPQLSLSKRLYISG
jgi:hypothetical protein